MSLACLDVTVRQLAYENHSSHGAQMVVLTAILPTLQLVHLISKGLKDDLPTIEQDFR